MKSLVLDPRPRMYHPLPARNADPGLTHLRLMVTWGPGIVGQALVARELLSIPQDQQAF